MQDFVRRFRNEKQRGILPSSSLLEAICNKREDLELLIEELENLSSKDYLINEFTGSGIPAEVSGGHISPKRTPKWPEFVTLAAEAKALLVEVKRNVFQHYRDIPEPDKTEVLSNPISVLKTTGSSTVIFTTNYDPAVEEYCAAKGASLVDGFMAHPNRRDLIWNRGVFDHFESSTADNEIVLFKLHGSTDWFKHRGRIIRAVSINDPSDTDFQSLMIYPAQRKVATDDPYFTAYDYLEQCLDNARGCLVIGYSFRDYDTLMRFKSAKLSNPDLKVLVLDPKANEICAMLGSTGIDDALAIPYPFGTNENAYLPMIHSAFHSR